MLKKGCYQQEGYGTRSNISGKGGVEFSLTKSQGDGEGGGKACIPSSIPRGAHTSLRCRKRGGDGVEGATKKEVRRRRRKAARQKRKDYYDLGAFYGRPTTCILLNFAQSLHQCDNHSLW